MVQTPVEILTFSEASFERQSHFGIKGSFFISGGAESIPVQLLSDVRYIGKC